MKGEDIMFNRKIEEWRINELRQSYLEEEEALKQIKFLLMKQCHLNFCWDWPISPRKHRLCKLFFNDRKAIIWSIATFINDFQIAIQDKRIDDMYINIWRCQGLEDAYTRRDDPECTLIVIAHFKMLKIYDKYKIAWEYNK
jgi:hypothetical protein